MQRGHCLPHHATNIIELSVVDPQTTTSRTPKKRRFYGRDEQGTRSQSGSWQILNYFKLHRLSHDYLNPTGTLDSGLERQPRHDRDFSSTRAQTRCVARSVHHIWLSVNMHQSWTHSQSQTLKEPLMINVDPKASEPTHNTVFDVFAT